MSEIPDQNEMDFELAVKCICTKCGNECLADEPDNTQAWSEQCQLTVKVINPFLE